MFNRIILAIFLGQLLLGYITLVYNHCIKNPHSHTSIVTNDDDMQMGMTWTGQQWLPFSLW